jgi:hypothetical protein
MNTRVPGLRVALRVIAIVALLFSALAVRVVVSSRSELLEARRLKERGDIAGSIVHFRRAARWYAPASPYHVEALSELGKIAREAERRGEKPLALSAYRAIRAAIMSTRSFYTPERDRLKAANRRIADLMASEPPPPIDAGKSREALRKEHLALLEAHHGPNIIWTCVLLLGFVAWVAGAFLFSIRAIDETDRFNWSEARRWGTVIVVGFGLFVLAMTLA